MTTRRHFLGTLGKALGTGGLLLPWAGKGALALPADLAEVGQIPLTAAPMPFSAECLQLREIKRALNAIPSEASRGHPFPGGPWRMMMLNEYHPAEERLVNRPVRSWTDCVELAENIWAFWSKQYRDAPYVGPQIPKLWTDDRDWNVYHQRHAIASLVEGVLTLGGGERFDPRIRGDEDTPDMVRREARR